MDKFNLTTEQLSCLIDKAFELGKIYATDELNSCAPFPKGLKVPVFRNEEQWEEFIEKSNGLTFDSRDAKTDILFEALTNQIRTRFNQTVKFN